MKTAYLLNLGIVDYRESLDIQEQLAYLRQAGRIEDTLILLEHPSCVTFGRRAHPKNKKSEMVKIPLEELERRIPVYDVGRGGFVTYHEPGQLVAYPILNFSNLSNGVHVPFVDTLRTLVRYVNGLEEVMIRVARSYGIDLVRKKALDTRSLFRHVGVWNDDSIKMRKVGSIGVETRSYPNMKVTMHGFAFNVNNSLELSNLIYPCGLDVEELSLERIAGYALPIEDVRRNVVENFADLFEYDIKEVKLEDILLEPATV
ncbi:MAG: lipoyl(octanoyl) transferase [Candidatus Aenigmarchaeota archaeon]|nr:lipoyl(octanoyl) transferase [Candidatus Aenigmarchaeota archaeon]